MDNKVDVIFRAQEKLHAQNIIIDSLEESLKLKDAVIHSLEKRLHSKDATIKSNEYKLQQTLNLLEKYSITLMEYGIAILHE
jgi:DNA-binding protein H-NS